MIVLRKLLKTSLKKKALLSVMMAACISSGLTGLTPLFPLGMAHAASAITYAGSAQPPAHNLALWYRQPATDWQTQALPIGNGYMGGMVYGGVEQEHIQFNEKHYGREARFPRLAAEGMATGTVLLII